MNSLSSEFDIVITGRKPSRRYYGRMRQNRETDKGKYAAFYNIPYAKIPEGVKRYQAPESLDASETEPYNARVFKNKPCAQVLPWYPVPGTKIVIGSADCLYLNIFLPRSPDEIDEPLPVLVHIHGGGFETGSNNPEVISPDFIIQEELVFVSINYRLGIHGFFNAHTKECPGNAGLKDQQKALEWIRDNIECFKGNPNNVTISGHSAGATCVHLHLIAPTSQDLFHKAIIQSGGIFFPWGYRGHRHEQEDLLMMNYEFKKLLDNYEGKSDALYLHTDKLLDEDRVKRHLLSYSPFYGPSVETVRDGAFIHKNIEKMMKDVNHVKPVMAGITKEEGIDVLSILSSDVDLVKKWSKNFLKFLMDNFRWSKQTAEDSAEEIIRKYFKGKWPDSDELSQGEKIQLFAKFIHDIFCRRFYDGFKFGPDEEIHRNLYVYQFEFFGELNIAKIHKTLKDYFNDATHEDDTRYMYCSDVQWHQLADARLDQDRLVAKRMCKMWANFCRDGIPDKDWKPHTKEKPCYLRIDKDVVLEQKVLGTGRWDWLHDFAAKRQPVNSLPATPMKKRQ